MAQTLSIDWSPLVTFSTGAAIVGGSAVGSTGTGTVVATISTGRALAVSSWLIWRRRRYIVAASTSEDGPGRVAADAALVVFGVAAGTGVVTIVIDLLLRLGPDLLAGCSHCVLWLEWST